MRILTFCLISLCLTAGFSLAQDKKAPDKLAFTAKPGTVTFDHSSHVKRADGDCKACHDTPFKEDATAPLNYKAAMHKPAETEKASCGKCHTPGGAAFASAGNCAKCHVKS